MSTFTFNVPASTRAFGMPTAACAALYTHVWSDVVIDVKRGTSKGSARSWRSPDC